MLEEEEEGPAVRTAAVAGLVDFLQAAPLSHHHQAMASLLELEGPRLEVTEGAVEIPHSAALRHMVEEVAESGA